MSNEGAVVRSYRDLVAWQESMRLVELVYALLSTLPVDERYGLASQLKRCSVSIPSNIAEGHARESTREFARFISIARGSLAEVETQLELISRLGMSSAIALEPAVACCDEVGRILRGLRKSLDNKLAALPR
ncbi:four helix bundle protein [Dyella sp. KRB-257]|uniref:four helix bundle protein n=1 Tax=Dyella sp. KRB-257 TaxID=3400915 RepID=UPI003BFD968B